MIFSLRQLHRRNIKRTFRFLVVTLLILSTSLSTFPTDVFAANTQIRQEINILDSYLTAASGSYATSSETVLLDTSKYTGATYYFEVVASTTAATNATVSLVNATSGAPVKNITVNGTSYARYRSSAFTATSTQAEYQVRLGNEAVRKGIIAARIIILQNTASIDSTETQIEIGNNETYTSTATSTLASPKYWSYNSTKWDGSPTFYAEVTYARTSAVLVAGSPSTFTTSNSWQAPADVTQVDVEAWGAGGAGGGRGSTSGGSGGGGGGAYAKSTLTVVPGNSYSYIVGVGGSGGTSNGQDGGNTSWNTSDVVAEGGKGGAATQTGGSGGLAANSTGTVKFSGGNGSTKSTNASPGGGGGGGAGSTGNGNNATANSATAGAAKTENGGAGGTGGSNANGSAGSNYGGGGGGAGRTSGNRSGGSGANGLIRITPYIANGTTTIAVQEDNGSFGGWTDKVYIVTSADSPSSSATRVRSNVFTPTNGRHYRIAFRSGYTGAVFAIYNAKIIVDQQKSLSGAGFVTSASYTSQDASPNAFVFNSDGTKAYIVGNTNDSIYQYTASTPYDISTLSYDSKSKSVGAQDTAPYRIFLNSAGTKMYMLGIANNRIYQYTLSTPGDISTASYDSKSFNPTTQDGGPSGLTFNADQSKMYVLGFANDTIYQYTLSTPGDISTASYASKAMSVTTQDSSPQDIYANSDVSNIYMIGSNNDRIYQYSLGTPGDLSTGSYTSASLDVSAQSTNGVGVIFSSDESKIYMTAANTFYQYNISSPTKLEPQYMLSPTKLFTGTGLQNYMAYWDPNEWSNVTNTYMHQMDAAASSASAAGIYTTANALVVGSTVTSPNNSSTSTAMTMPVSATDLDVKATTNNNDVYANRILVDVVIRPSDPTSATVTADNTQNLLSWTQATNASSTIVLRRAGSAVTDTPTDTTNYATSTTIGSSVVACVGNQTSCTDTGLSNGTAYHYKIFTWGTSGYYSTGVVPTGSPATPAIQTYTEQAYKFFNATSTYDGTTAWTMRTSATANTWRSVAYGNGRFVAVAENGTTANDVMYSIDGTNWTSASLSGVPSAYVWNSVTYGNGLFVAVASIGMTMSSPDGINWTSHSGTAANPNWASVTYGNGLFVAVAQDAQGVAWDVMTSPDGAVWTARTAAANNSWRTVTYGNGKFVAISFGGTTANNVMYSTDGITWSSGTSPNTGSWSSVAYGNGKFVAVAQNGTTATDVMYSTDGITWTSASLSGVPGANLWETVTFGNGLFVAVANSSSVGGIMTSSDGINWTGLTSPAASPWHGLTYGNGIFVAVAGSGNTANDIMTSGAFGPHPGAELAATSTAATLTSVGQPFRLRLLQRVDSKNLSANSGVSFKLQYAVKSGTCDTSFSGETYADITDSTPIAYYDNPDFRNRDLAIATSSDPIDSGRTVRYEGYREDNNFTDPVAIAAGETGLWDFSLYDNGASAGTSYCIRVVKSMDAQTWTSRSASNTNSWSSVAYGNGTYVAVASGGPSADQVMTSSDGITWTGVTPPESNAWRAVTYGNGKFVAVSSNGTNRVMTSPDGVTWTAQSAATANSWFAVTYGNGKFVALSQTSGTGNQVMTSPDGVTWTMQTSATDNAWSGITYGNGLFVAVGASGGGTRLMTSPDGITWTARTAAEDNTWTSVTYGNGLFVAVSSSGTNRVMTSPDGITWTARTAAEDNTWTSVTYGNGLFVAVSSSGTNRVMTSPDGITWTAQTASEANSWVSVTYGNGTYVAVSTDGTNQVMSSPISTLTLDTYSVVPEIQTAAGAGANLTQLHYRWRNDNGTEAGATFAAAEDTALTSGVNVGDRLRVRFVISDTSGSASNYTYQLQQASSSCTSWINVPNTETNGTHWVADFSQYYLSGGATTNNASLTDPNGQSFVAGYQMAGTAITPAHSLSSGQFTEHEFSIRSTRNVSFGTTYCFRLTNAGATTGFTYTKTPQISVSFNPSVKAGGGTTEGNGTGATITGGTNTGGSGNAGGEGNGSGTPRSGGGSGGGGGDTGFIFQNHFLVLFRNDYIYIFDPYFSYRTRR